MSVRVGLLTVTLTATDVPTLSAASYAFAVSECEPFATDVESQLYEYGEVVSVDLSAPSTYNSTFVTPTLSEAVALMETVPTTVAPFSGAVIETVGAVTSPPPPPVPFASQEMPLATSRPLS